MTAAHGRAPLGLPRGSVRAALTLMALATVCADLVRGFEPHPVWVQTLMVVLAHYFTTRRFVDLPPEVLARLEREGIVHPEPNPLYLPRFTIRVLIVLVFAGVAAYLLVRGELLHSSGASLLLVIFAYFAGLLWRRVARRWSANGTRAPGWWPDAKAAMVLVAAGLLTLAHVLGQGALLPQAAVGVVPALVLFYFGSR